MDTTQRVFKAAKDLMNAKQWRNMSGGDSHYARLVDHQRAELKLALERWDRERVGGTAAHAVKESITSPSPMSAAKTSSLGPGASCRGSGMRTLSFEPRRTAASARFSCGAPLADLIGEN